jgi:hypothetical protein
MQGYAWTAAGPAEPNNDTGSISTIAPADFTAVAAGDTLCASGVVAEDADYGGYAMIGVNIGQEVSQVEGEETPNVNITPTGTGITVSVTNNGGSALRIQIQDDLGATDAAHRWCANLPASGQATIEWGEFNTECWAPAGGPTTPTSRSTRCSCSSPGRTARTPPSISASTASRRRAPPIAGRRVKAAREALDRRRAAPVARRPRRAAPVAPWPAARVRRREPPRWLARRAARSS